jgi:hypothetical protein
LRAVGLPSQPICSSAAALNICMRGLVQQDEDPSGVKEQ